LRVEYLFAKFDVKLEIVRFTDEQYEQYFANGAYREHRAA